MARVFNVGLEAIAETTTPADIRAWDSASHLVMITGLEKAFDVDLPMAKAYAAQSVGDVISVVAEALHSDAG